MRAGPQARRSQRLHAYVFAMVVVAVAVCLGFLVADVLRAVRSGATSALVGGQ